MTSEGIDSSTDNSKKCHDGHRQRLREKYIRGGADSLENHELLEMLLYYCILRRNTNEIAHAMLDRFGSLENVFAADIDELKEFSYMSENSAVLVKLVGELNRRCMLEKASEVERYDTIEKVGNFLLGIFKGQNTEKLYLLTFDSGMRMLECICIGEGGIGSVNMSIRKIIESTVSTRAANIIIAHNHPGGIAVPSKNDLSLTHQLETLMGYLDTKLLCHIIVAGDKYSPVSYPSSGKFDLTV